MGEETGGIIGTSHNPELSIVLIMIYPREPSLTLESFANQSSLCFNFSTGVNFDTAQAGATHLDPATDTLNCFSCFGSTKMSKCADASDCYGAAGYPVLRLFSGTLR